MARTFYKVRDGSNFAETRWDYDNRDPFGRVDDWQPGYLIITPIPGGGVGFPSPPRQRPICTVQTFASDGVTLTPTVPPTDFRFASNYGIVSDRLKRLLETFDPDAFSFIEIEMRWAGWGEARTGWLVRIVRSFVTRDPVEIPEETHAFMAGPTGRGWYFDQAICDALNAEGVTGFRFKDINQFWKPGTVTNL